MISQRRRGAAIVHTGHLDAGEIFQLKPGDVQRGSHAGGAVRHAPRLLLRERDQFGDRIHREGWIDQECLRNGSVADDRHEVLLHVVGQFVLAVEMRLGRVEAGLRREQRVAVVLRPQHGLRRDRISGAAAVLDDDALLPRLGKPQGDRTGEHVGERPGRRGDHDGDVALRITLRQRGGAGQQAGEQKQAAQHGAHRSLRCSCRRLVAPSPA
jgi:hypothetical protein